jgi:hypothetical protein
MEKSSLNIKSFRNLLSGGTRSGKSYKIPPQSCENYAPNEVKIIDSKILEPSTHVDDGAAIYHVKPSKSNASTGNDNECNQRNLNDIVCDNFIKLIGNYDGNFCLPIFTPISAR